MPSVDALSTLPTVAALPADSPAPAVPSPETNFAQMMDAFSSQAGVAVRLIATLPANLGQSLDISA